MRIAPPAVAFAVLLAVSGMVCAQISIGVATPGVRIGINVPAYPQLVPVPGYPVYYAPQLPANYFFYDGAYWVYFGDAWYVSRWYNGPWQLVSPDAVPLYLLRVPVRYYRRPPPFFRGWRADAPPRWGEHWGPGWVGHHPGWDRFDRRVVPPRAALPTYQRQYSGNRYPNAAEQARLHERNYATPRPERVAPAPRGETRTMRAPAEVHRGGGRPEGGGRGERGAEHGRGEQQ